MLDFYPRLPQMISTSTLPLQVCSFAIFGNFEVNKNCHFWQFLDSIITDENAKYCQKWQKK